MSIDFRQCLYALSDVILNRPPPLRCFDQIYMKIPDLLLQAEHVSRWFKDKDVVFIGDGDAIALTVAHLGYKKLLPGLPSRIHVLDFDERVVNSVNNFAARCLQGFDISSSLYNVADELPPACLASFDCFYTNPPWGASNAGSSVKAFVQRGIEAVKQRATGCLVIADDPSVEWSLEVQKVAQNFCLGQEFRVAEMLPQFHMYHLDDSPDLRSCSMVFERQSFNGQISSIAMEESVRTDFYGKGKPLEIRYVRDLAPADGSPSRDIKLEAF